MYAGPTAFTHWFHQVIAWLLILTVVKIFMYLFMWVFSQPLAWVGQVMFRPLQGNIRFELLFVMILFPGLLNVIYFWIADHHLKAKPEQSDAHEEIEGSDLSDKKESLLTDDDKKEAFDPKAWTSTDRDAGTIASMM